MILEMIQYEIRPGAEADFEKAYAKALLLLKRSPGCIGGELRRAVERRGRYRAIIRWETIEHHIDGFRGSTDWSALMELMKPFGPPEEIAHYDVALPGF